LEDAVVAALISRDGRHGMTFAPNGAKQPGKLAATLPSCHFPSMSTLAEIEAAAENLSAQEKEELFLFLAARLRAPGAPIPEPRKFSKEQMAAWIAEDEEDMRQLREGA